MCVILLLFAVILLPSLSISDFISGTGETCNTLSDFVSPHQQLRPDWPKNDVCRYRESPHCCTPSVETVMKGYANTDAHTLFFGHLMKMRDLTSNQYYSIQSLELPYLSESLRETALEYKLLDNLSTGQENLVTQATVEYLSIYYKMEHMPEFCKKDVVRDMRLSVHIFLQELMFSHELVEANWLVAKDLFAVVFSSQFTPHCITELIRAGMTRLSCKTCTDHTIRIPTCFNYCVDVTTSCLEPYQPIIELINQWFNLYVQVQRRIEQYIHYDRFLQLKNKLNELVDAALQDSFFADVCAFHFDDRRNSKNSEYSIVDTPNRRRRLVKTTPAPQIYSSRPFSLTPTSATPHTEYPTVVGNQLFDPLMICLNATQTVTNDNCWNGTGMGVYDSNRMPSTEATPTNMFEFHVKRLQSKIDNLVVSLRRDLVIVGPTETNNHVEHPSPDPQNAESFGHKPNFKTVTILLIVMTWITLIV